MGTLPLSQPDSGLVGQMGWCMSPCPNLTPTLHLGGRGCVCVDSAQAIAQICLVTPKGYSPLCRK